MKLLQKLRNHFSERSSEAHKSIEEPKEQTYENLRPLPNLGTLNDKKKWKLFGKPTKSSDLDTIDLE